jgi:hypothetical protein
MNRDLLAELREGALGANDAEPIANEILASPDASKIMERLCLSKKEYTAYMHGAPFDVIAHWRYDGWPARCERCLRTLDSDLYGWRVRETQGGTFALEHLTCP